MNWEIILSVVSLAITLLIGILTLIINHRISKINNTKDLHTYQKHITQFELQFKDEDWLYDLIVVRDEFDHYDPSSKKRIANWFAKYAKKYPLKKLKIIDIDTPAQVIEEKLTDVQAEEEPKEEKPAKPKKNKGRKKKTQGLIIPRGRLGEGKVVVVNTDLDKMLMEERLRQALKSPIVTLHEDSKAARVITTIEDEFDGDD